MILVACLLLGTLAPVQAQGPHPALGGNFVPGEVLVQFQPGVAAVAREGLLAGVAAQELDTLPALDLVRLRVPVGQERAIAARLNVESLVRAAGLNYVARVALVPNDTFYASYQWNLSRINAPAAWSITTGSRDVIVAVVDTGLDPTHPEFAGRIVPGYDFVNDDANPDDDNGHGTHVAGIALAAGNNGIGIAGVSWGARVMPVKTFGASGFGTLANGIDGIIWAAYNGAYIINLSWTVEIPPDDPSRSILQGTIDYAYQKGCLIVAAAGNQCLDGNPVLYPAACNHVVAVAATGTSDERALYSEVQSYVDVAAPGGVAMTGSEPTDHYILSTQWQGAYPTFGYGLKSGTSQATPHVAGLAALVWTMNPYLTPDEVVTYIQAGAVNLGDPNQFGAGRIDAWATLQNTPHYLQLSPTHLTFLADPVATVPAWQQVVNPASSGSSWSVAGGTSWMTVSGPTGQTPSSITVTANASGLSGYGVYPAAILANSTMPYKANSPVVINVTLIYTEHLYRVYLPAVQNMYAP
jgi:subtilisin family serine protease